MNSTSLAREIEEIIGVVDEGERREVGAYIRPSYEGCDGFDMHHLFDGSQPYYAKLWVGDGLTFKHEHEPGGDGDTERAGASNAYAGENNLEATGVGTFGADELMFALEVMWGWVELSDPSSGGAISVNVAGCKGAVTGVSSPNGFTAQDYVVDGVTGESEKQQAMAQLMCGLNTGMTPTVVLDLRMQLNSIAVNENDSAGTSTITIGGVGVFTTDKRHEDIMSLLKLDRA